MILGLALVLIGALLILYALTGFTLGTAGATNG